MSSRYYETKPGSEIRPGVVSDELRKALGLSDTEVPIWIYRMRALGYPPGWLKKAIVEDSDIFETDETSNKRKSPDATEIQYDHKKLIEYPGFNSPMPDKCPDYHFYVNMPAMLEHQQLEYAKQHMNALKPIQIPKRPKLDRSDDAANSSNDESLNITNCATSDPESPPLEDTIDAPDSSDNKPPKVVPEELKLVSKGSPMPKPVNRLPLEKFSEGVVGELLYFENISSSTGSFGNIRGLLNDIRKSKSEGDKSFESV